MRMALLIALLASSSLAQAKMIHVGPGGNAQEKLQTALIEAQPGDTVHIAAGRYALADGLSLDVDGVTVKGDGPDKTILDFTAQKVAGEGLLITSDNVVVRDLGIENAAGNGVKSKGSDGIALVNLRVEWTGGPKSTNGAYGLYPVSSKNVLIDRSVVKGASDAGIYVGQSQNIIVRGSRAEMNVAGIEIENSYDADVVGNTATNNAGGILVFDLPDLPQQGGRNVKLTNNQVIANNHVNFAAPGNIVAGVPSGTGIMVMANSNVLVTGNHVMGNNGSAVMVVAYTQAFTDKAYNPLPRSVSVAGNHFMDNGKAPAFAGGKEIAAAVGGTIPPVLWDGITRYAVPGGGGEKLAEGGINIDAPGISLNLGLQGTPATQARPAPMQQNLVVSTRPAIVLPAALEARAK
ncbi:parallel beta-helix domain-containing protein [Sandarakinorhabdus limnophila]|jgi:parallel beta-helix repeat protein|uniref:parallel beta-helix domain-containing protein n=1 Tax=Sandarakinorhabdus limnophila TaxID=210512 RepID=UPI002353AC08|nr:parallel beta-helix domain-containing protein [Sandarakinorhabdus limnophila]